MTPFTFKLKFTKEDIAKNRMLAMGVGIAVLFAWYGYNRVYRPTIGTIRQINAEVANEGKNADILRRLGQLQQRIAARQASFVKESDMLWLVDKVSRAAAAAGLKVKTLNSKPLVPLKGFIYSSVNVIVSGTFHQLGDFVSKIEGSKEFIRIERLSFKKEGEFLEADMVISTYFNK